MRSNCYIRVRGYRGNADMYIVIKSKRREINVLKKSRTWSVCAKYKYLRIKFRNFTSVNTYSFSKF